MILCALSFAMLFISCTKDVRREGPVFGISRAALSGIAPGTTFRMMAFSQTDNSLAGTGTYFFENMNDTHLEPCALKSDGTFAVTGDRIDYTCGLTVNDGTYRMVCLSPGIVNNNGEISFNSNAEGFNLRTTMPESVEIGQYGLITLNGKLTQPRATIKFKIYLGSDMTSDQFTVSNPLTVEGAAAETEDVSLNLITRAVSRTLPAGDLSLTAVPSTENIADQNGNPLKYVTPDKKYIAAGKYPDLRLKGVFNISGKDVSVDIPLTDKLPENEISRQYNYIYNIVASSHEVMVYLVIVNNATDTDWEMNDDLNGEIGSDVTKIKINLGIFKVGDGHGWEDVNPGDQIID